MLRTDVSARLVSEHNWQARVLRAHCNLSLQRQQLEALLERCTERDAEPRQSRTVRKLRSWDREVLEQVLADYREGVPIAALSRAYGMHHQTVRAHLRRSGVELRPLRVMTDVQIAEAARLYAQGWSTNRLGKRYGVGAATVGINLKRRLGVELRPRGFAGTGL